MPNRIIYVLLACSTACPGVDIQLITNSASGITTIERMDLEDLYLGKKSKMPDGTKATVLTNGNAEETQRFLSIYLDKTPSSFSAAWKRMVFTGKGTPPREAKDDSEMIDLVKKTVGAIGYVSADAAIDGVTKLAVAK